MRTHASIAIALSLFGLVACSKSQKDQDSKTSTQSGQSTSGESAQGQGAGDSAARGNIRFVVVTHGQASDSFWSVVQNGVQQAARDMGVKVEYQAPTSFDMVAMGQLIDAAVASKPDGLAVSIPDADALRKPIQNAIQAGIPVVSLNSGAEVAKELGILVHVGQTEYEAGYGAGERMAKSGVKKALCVNHEVGNASQDLRCKGFTEAMQKAGATVQVLAVELADPTESAQRISAAVTADAAIDGILALGPLGAGPALKALTDDKKEGKVKLATFDLSPEVLEAIRDGKMLFAVDQQQYLQGYLPIVILTLYKTNLNTPGNDVLRTGPGFVDQSNAARVIELAKKGTR